MNNENLQILKENTLFKSSVRFAIGFSECNESLLHDFTGFNEAVFITNDIERIKTALNEYAIWGIKRSIMHFMVREEMDYLYFQY